MKWWHCNASLGKAPVYGGGCGAFGGNPDGCPANTDTKPPGSWYYFMEAITFLYIREPVKNVLAECVR